MLDCLPSLSVWYILVKALPTHEAGWHEEAEFPDASLHANNTPTILVYAQHLAVLRMFWSRMKLK